MWHSLRSIVHLSIQRVRRGCTSTSSHRGLAVRYPSEDREQDDRSRDRHDPARALTDWAHTAGSARNPPIDAPAILSRIDVTSLPGSITHARSVVLFESSGYRGVHRNDRVSVGEIPDRLMWNVSRQRRRGIGREDQAASRQLVLRGGVVASVSDVSRPICTAKRTISLRVRSPSFSAIRARYVSTVFTLTSVCFAMS